MKETSIIYQGNKECSSNTFNIFKSIEKALALDHNLPDWISGMSGMSGKKYRYFINNLIASLSDARYLEVGSWMGSTACSAAYGNKLNITCIDNWSQFNGPKEDFLRNIDNIKSNEITFNFIESDFRSVDYNNIGKYNIYLFDGPHERKDQYDGVIYAQPCLDDDFILIVDDWNWLGVRQGTLEALEEIAEILFRIDIRTSQDDTAADPPHHEKSDWHNGVFIAACKKKIKNKIETTIAITKYWVNQQLIGWESGKISQEKYNVFTKDITAKYGYIYSFDIQNGEVRFDPRPHINDGCERRFNLYLEYLKRIALKSDFRGSIRIPICVGDCPPEQPLEYPIFSFDKTEGSEKILIPDTDYLVTNCYKSILSNDPQNFSEKFNRAIFAGSTTGGGGLSLQKIINKKVPRIKSAEYFKDSELVLFKITNICQTEDQQIIDYISNLGILIDRVSWESQINYKFLISVDGNGATWSRIVNALCSNSVLLKYDSPRTQFYYDSLVPWLHYIPISSDQEIEKIVQSEIDYPGKYEYIAEASSKFATSYLNKEVIDCYVIELLKSFSNLFK